MSYSLLRKDEELTTDEVYEGRGDDEGEVNDDARDIEVFNEADG